MIVEGKLAYIKDEEYGPHGPWRLYQLEPRGQKFLAHPGEYKELDALRGEYVRLEVEHSYGAYQYLIGTVATAPEPENAKQNPRGGKQRIVWLACLKAAANLAAPLGSTEAKVAVMADKLLEEYEKRWGGV